MASKQQSKPTSKAQEIAKLRQPAPVATEQAKDQASKAGKAREQTQVDLAYAACGPLPEGVMHELLDAGTVIRDTLRRQFDDEVKSRVILYQAVRRITKHFPNATPAQVIACMYPDRKEFERVKASEPGFVRFTTSAIAPYLVAAAGPIITKQENPAMAGRRRGVRESVKLGKDDDSPKADEAGITALLATNGINSVVETLREHEAIPPSIGRGRPKADRLAEQVKKHEEATGLQLVLNILVGFETGQRAITLSSAQLIRDIHGIAGRLVEKVTALEKLAENLRIDKAGRVKAA